MRLVLSICDREVVSVHGSERKWKVFILGRLYMIVKIHL